MIKIKKTAFTLSEALITLTVVGMLGALVLPGLIRNTINRANMALLQSTVTQLNDAIQTKLVQNKTSYVKDALYKTNSDGTLSIRDFVRDSFDIAEECSMKYGTSCTAGSGPAAGDTGVGTTGYKTLNGKDTALFLSEPTLLANGVAIDFFPNYSVSGNDIVVRVDLNGKKAPNVIGVDTFYLYIVGTTDLNNGRQIGDVRGIIQPGIDISSTSLDDVTEQKLFEHCKSGSPSTCFVLLERTGFDPDYLNKDYEEE